MAMTNPMRKPLKYILGETTHLYDCETFNHCSTLLSADEELLVAFYTCDHECSDNQRVVLTNNKTTIEFEDGTGNPVLYKDALGDNYILYSKFVDNPFIARPVMKWAFCDLFIRKIEDVGSLKCSEPVKLADSGQHLLGRCTPIVSNGKTILPLYDEYAGECVLYSGNGFDFSEFKRFGSCEIQPAIWYDGNLNALTRNFRSNNFYSKIHVGDSSSVTSIPNNNSSIAVLYYMNSLLYVYNNTVGMRRKDLSVGVYTGSKNFQNLMRLDSYGSYPTIIGHRDGFAISYTSFYKTIKVRWFSNNHFFSAASVCMPESQTDILF